MDLQKVLEKWQKDGMTRSRGVFISRFNLYPQSQGFGMDVEFHIVGKYNPEWGYDKVSFFGSLEDIVNQVEETLRKEKQEILESLEDV